MPEKIPPAPAFRRVAETDRAPLTIWCDGVPVAALQGDTVLAAIRLAGGTLRETEFDRRPRAGFCLMGACNDCIVWTAEGTRLRACSTPVSDGMQVFTRLPESAEWPPLIS